MPKEKTQREKFQEAARELGIDEDDSVFLAAVAKIAKASKLSDDAIKELARQQRDALRKSK